jgi:hypothetical protein
LAKKSGKSSDIKVETHRDIVKNMREINRRFNENPDLARLLIVNPILALGDIGVKLNTEMRHHIMDTFRFPPRVRKRKERLEAELNKELPKLISRPKLPLTGKQRAELVFRVLKLKPHKEDSINQAELESNRTRFYASQHPIVAKLAEYERVRQGSLIFHTRETYEDFKSGKKKHRWLKAVRFKER